MEYAITIVTADNRTHEYLDMGGPVARAKTDALDRFRKEGTGGEVVEVLSLPMGDYFHAHQCRDTTGSGCCNYCGGVIPGSFLDREINGGD